VLRELGRLVNSIPAPVFGISVKRVRSRSNAVSERASERLGRVLAAIALLLQLALPGLHTPPLLGFDGKSGTFSNILDEHALCLVRDGGDKEAPPDRAPRPENDGFLNCCLWHGTATLGLVAPAASAPAEFPASEIVFARSAAIITDRPVRAFGARAPPTRG
jgi:hypothetical protein